jgi:Holliday junction resolvase RusA-like endonuclease
MVILNLPLPPTVNHYLKSSGYRRYLSKEAIEFKKQVADYVSEYKIPKLGDARLEMHITIYFANKRRQDLDNRVKSLWDSLGSNGAGVFNDDSQIDILFLQRGEIKKGGGCLVMIEILDKIEENTPIT